VVSGDEEAVEAVAAAFAGRGVKSKRLVVSHAFHSARMEPMLEAFARVAETVTYGRPALGLVSNVSGKLCTEEVSTAGYWVRHVREAVRFGEGVKALAEAGAGTFVEMGPKAVLLGLVPACLPGAEPLLLASLRAGQDEAASILEALGTYWVRGGAATLSGLFPAGGRRVQLPTYAFQRERYWIEALDVGATRGEATGHPLLGVRVPAVGTGAVFETALNLGSHPWLADHQIGGQVVVPGAAVAEMVRAAAAHSTGSAPRVNGLVLQAPLTLPETRGRRVQVILTETGGKAPTAAVYSQPVDSGPGAGWTLHATATLGSIEGELGERTQTPAALDLQALQSRCMEALPLEAMYESLAALGLAYGPAFRGMRALWRGDGESLGQLALPAGFATAGYGVFPGLLDAAFQAVVGASAAGLGELQLPFELGSFSVYEAGAEAAWVHVRLHERAAGMGAVADVTLADAGGAVVAEVTDLRFQRADPKALQRRSAQAPVDAFYQLEWREAPLPDVPQNPAPESWVVVANVGSEHAAALSERLGRCTVVEPAGLEVAVAASPGAGVICLWEARADEPTPVAAQRIAIEGLAVVQALSSRPPVQLWWVTFGAVAVEPGDSVAVGAATVWGLGRTVMQEHPELGCTLIDLEPGPAALDALERELSSVRDFRSHSGPLPSSVRDPHSRSGPLSSSVRDPHSRSGPLSSSVRDPEVVWRGGRRCVARLTRVTASDVLPTTEDYQLELRGKGTLDALHLAPAARRPPLAGEVQIEVRASGINFRDVLNALGMYPGEAGPLGSECAGVVVAVGDEVAGLSVGDAVIALAPGAFRRFVTVDARVVTHLPAGLTFEQGAAIPIVFLTAWYALHDLAQLRPGERLLVHAAAGGVGMAAVQLAQRIGAEVVATASPTKWDVVRSMGVAQVASSRTVEFATTLRQVSSGRGVDVVLNSLAGEFVDASLSLLSAGGRMLEMGKTDIRDSAAVTAAYPGVRYRAFDLFEAGLDRIREMLAAIGAGFAEGSLRPLPVKTYPITEAEAAFRFMGQARHVGKLVLVPPRANRLEGEGTVLVTGGLGALGMHVARWLAGQGVAHLVLTGRRGLETPGAAEAVKELEALGAKVTVAAVDVADRSALEAVLAAVPKRRPLRGVVHVAGVLEDGVLGEQTGERFARVLAPKVAGAWNLHELTADADLTLFVMFSSMAGLLGSSGQSSYAAANSFLDALAAHRRARGLAAQSLAWGAWAEAGMAAKLGALQQGRMERQGMMALAPAEGIALLEQAVGRREAQLGVMRLDLAKVKLAMGATVPPVWRVLVKAAAERASGVQGGWAVRLAKLPEGRRVEEVRTAVQADVARVLSLREASQVPLEAPLAELGLDSLMAVELRNALSQRVGVALPATLAFDYPTVTALTRWLLDGALAVSEMEVPVPAASPKITLEEPIALIGIGCRFPGGVSSPESFWRLLDEGIDAIAEVPRDRWDIDAWYDPDPDAPGKMTTRWGGFVPDLDRFDPGFFGISPGEAVSLDPQARMLLETSWEALEHAGQTPERLMGSDTGVYVGLCSNEYQLQAMGDIRSVSPYALLGTAHSAMVGRLSYFLGLKGPNLAVDTACSSSLVAVHLACQALRQGECSLALAGGANVVLSPEGTVYFSRLRAMSPTGRCHTFSADADGYVRSEGCGVVVLKRLSDAQRDGDRVLGVIRGSAINQDGRSNGLTAPNGPSQEAVIRRALAQAGIAPAEVDYVECHGTGTALGDPIEVQALGAVLSEGRAKERPVVLGSVKTNFGHTEGAAGVAGLIKAVLALEHGRIPKSLHFTKPNPHIAWSELDVAVAAEAVEWPRNGTPRRAGVSSFGFSGTNAHVVLEEPPTRQAGEAAQKADVRRPDRREGADASTDLRRPDVAILPLSAKSPEALVSMEKAYRRVLREGHPGCWADLAYTASVRRSHHEHRLALVAGSQDEALAQLEAWQGDETRGGHGGVVGGAGVSQKVVFVFNGQGSQWAGMGRQLLAQEPVFRASIAACDELVKRYAGWSLREQLAAGPETSRLDETEVAQPALLAIQVAVAELYRSWGIVPSAVVGHSVGEVAAAHVAGALTLEQAVRLAVTRGRLMQRATGQGRMASVAISFQEATEALRGYEERLGIAAINDRESVVLSGEAEALAEVTGRLAERHVACRHLRVQYAFHSPQMNPTQAELVGELGDWVSGDGSIPIYSTVTGARIEGSELDPAYWGRNVREPVQLAGAIGATIADGYRTFVEIGPHPVLAMHLEQCLEEQDEAGQVLTTLRREADERRGLLQSVAALYTRGYPVDWQRLHPEPRQCLALPTYPWDRKRYWTEPSGARPRETARATELTPALLSLLDATDDAALAATLGLSQASPDDASAMARVLGAIRRKARQVRAESEIQPWMYTLEWQCKPLGPAASRGAGHWVVLVDEEGTGDRLVEKLAAAGGTCLRVRRGKAVQRLAPDLWTVDPTSAKELGAFWAARTAELGPVRGIIHLWSLSRPSPEADDLDSVLEQGVLSALSWLQCVVENESRQRPRLWFVTRGAMSVGASDPVVAPEQAPLWGLGRVVSLEHPDVWGGLVDLPAEPGEATLQLLAQHVLGGDGEDQAAVRAGGRFVPRLVRHRSAAERPTSWPGAGTSSRGTVLITGGLGALGLRVARWLLEQGIKHLVLTSRRGVETPQATSAVEALRASGASVTVMQADVADAEAVRALLAEIDGRLPPLAGIVHAAGVLDDGVLVRQNASRFSTVFAPKIRGAWNLHTLTQHRPLEFFVLFSSMASVLGSPGQGNYAAANAFLDALALQRQSRGMPAHSVNWAAWSDGGMAGEQLLATLQKRGLTPLRPEMAVECLGPILAGVAAQVMVVDADWARFRAIYESDGERAILAELPRAEWAHEAATERAWIEQLKSASPRERPHVMRPWLQRVVAEILGLDGPGRVEADKGFFELGMDSLKAMELRKRLHQALGVRLRATVMFNYPSVTALGGLLLDELALTWGTDPHPAKDDPVTDVPPQELESLAEDEVARLLEEQIAEHEEFLS
jgi:acyl transferase domain-containing protein/NADPH:quinone reductase-like Zn-dependent oxidoreductase/acyl carrier protein